MSEHFRRPWIVKIDGKEEIVMHPATKAMMKNFRYGHLPDHLKEVSAPICDMARKFAAELEGPELTAGLRKLLEAKDCFVRAAVAKHEEPKEQEAVDASAT